jgi:hypothetical protein
MTDMSRSQSKAEYGRFAHLFVGGIEWLLAQWQELTGGEETDLHSHTASGGVIVSPAAPIDPTLGQLWARQLDISGGYQLYRFAGGEAWQALGAGVGAPATSGPFADTVTRQVGIIVGDPADGYFAGLAVNTSDGVAHIKYESADGATSAKVECTPTSLRLSYSGTSHFPTILLDENGLQLYGLPVDDPVVVGALWQSGADLKISAGPPPP